MKNKEQIEEELKIRQNFKNSDSYGSLRTNKNVINTLKWILDLPSPIKSHCKKLTPTLQGESNLPSS